MLFLTVGTQFSFDRLVRAVDDALDNGAVDEQIFAQIGESSYRPRNFEYAKLLDKQLFDKYVAEASGIISHAGVGTITMALNNAKPLLVMPRLKKYGEVVNDHQVAMARKFEELGHALVLHDVRDLPDYIDKLKNFVPRKRIASPHAVANRIRCFLNNLSESENARGGDYC